MLPVVKGSKVYPPLAAPEATGVESYRFRVIFIVESKVERNIWHKA